MGDGNPHESVGLSYIDLLYALPVAAMAEVIRGLQPSKVGIGGWMTVFLALTAVTCGWIGHHNNRARLPQCLKQQEERWFFTTPRFPQFVLEILIIVVYFALVLSAGRKLETNGTHVVVTVTRWIALGFLLYLLWDHLDIWIATGPWYRETPCPSANAWAERAVKGAYVTLLFVGIFGGICLWAWNGPAFAQHVVVVDVVLIVLLFAYRCIQELWCAGGWAARRNYE